MITLRPDQLDDILFGEDDAVESYIDLHRTDKEGFYWEKVIFTFKGKRYTTEIGSKQGDLTKYLENIEGQVECQDE